MGWPVSHSLSPRLHNRWLEHLHIDGAYIPMPVHPSRLEQALRALPVLGFRGCNLTIPHKEKALSIVDEFTDLARRVGAINTIVVEDDGRLIGNNTDVFGFQENLKAAGFKSHVDMKSATVLGAGGAARAIVVALQDLGFTDIRLVNRTREKAELCASALKQKDDIRIFEWEQTTEAMEGSKLLVNTTALGMKGQPDLMIDLSPLAKEAWVTDVVYNPLITGLLRQAEEKGFYVVDGLGMLIHQARPSFHAWFGLEPHVNQDIRNYVLNNGATSL